MDDNSVSTATNMTVGSLAYAPPEQLMGASLDGRTDQYALAATAFQLLDRKATIRRFQCGGRHQQPFVVAAAADGRSQARPVRISTRSFRKRWRRSPPTGTQPAVTSRQPFPNASKPPRRPTTRRWWPGRPPKPLQANATQLAAAAPSAPPLRRPTRNLLEANASGSSPRRSVRPYSWPAGVVFVPTDDGLGELTRSRRRQRHR